MPKKGYKQTKEHRNKVSISKKGFKKPSNSYSFPKASSDGMNYTHPSWVENPRYMTIHSWLIKHFKKNKACEICDNSPGLDSIGRSKLQWSNISGKYLRDRNDYRVLCARCHKRVDGKTVKLSSEEVREIKILLRHGVYHKEIAKIYNVSKSNIGAINTGITWRDI